MKCEKCDYKVVTTNTFPIELDDTLYKLTILNNECTISQVTTLFNSLLLNFADINKILIERNNTYEILYSDIIDGKKILYETNVLYKKCT